MGLTDFNPGVGFALGRSLARRAVDVHVPVGVVGTVCRQNVWTGPLGVCLAQGIGDRVRCKLSAIAVREPCVRVLCEMGL